MKKAYLAVLCVVLMLLSGCSDFNIGSDSLLYAPALNKEQSFIYNVLISSVGKNITLKYPKNGSNRSAVVITNIDDDESAEAIVFYQKDDAAATDTSVRVNIIDKVNGKWRSVYDISGEGKDIDKVIIKDIENIGKTIFIGYGTLNKSINMLCGYKYSNNVLTDAFSTPYSYFDVVDLKGGDKSDIFVMNQNEDLKVAEAYFLGFDEDRKIYEKSRVSMCAPANDYKNISISNTDKGKKIIVLDSLSENNTIKTEILGLANGKLYNPMAEAPQQFFDVTLRQSAYTSVDFNRDGIIEIPITTPFAGYYDVPDEQKIMATNWYDFEMYYKLKKKYTSFYNFNDGYVFILPGRWTGMVTIKKDSVTDEYVFYKFDETLDNSTTELMRIKVSLRKNTENYIDAGYTLIYSKGRIDYMVKIPDDSNEPLILTVAEVTNSFYVQ